MITGWQIRAARAALRWSAAILAEKAEVAPKTVARFEETDDVPPSRSSNLMQVRRALEAAGIEFLGTPDESPGIRLRKRNPE